MGRKTKAPRPTRADRAAEQADYAAWKITAGADLLERHDVMPYLHSQSVCQCWTILIGSFRGRS
jgi:hypothetical protein